MHSNYYINNFDYFFYFDFLSPFPFCHGCSSSPFVLAGISYSVLLLVFFCLKISTLKAFIFVCLTGSNAIQQKLPSKKYISQIKGLWTQQDRWTQAKSWVHLESNFIMVTDKSTYFHLCVRFTSNIIYLPVTYLGSQVNFLILHITKERKTKAKQE